MMKIICAVYIYTVFIIYMWYIVHYFILWFMSCVVQLSAVGSPSLGWSWVFAIGVLGISCLGIFAGCSEKDIALKIVRESTLLIFCWFDHFVGKSSHEQQKKCVLISLNIAHIVSCTVCRLYGSRDDRHADLWHHYHCHEEPGRVSIQLSNCSSILMFPHLDPVFSSCFY